MPRRVAVLVCLLAGATILVRGQQLPGAFPPLERYLEPLREQAGIPGMSAAVVQNGVIIWESGFGYQDVGARIGATPDTPYLVADLSQTLASILILQCVEQRRLTLDELLQRLGLPAPDQAPRTDAGRGNLP